MNKQSDNESLSDFLSALDEAASKFGLLINHTGEVYEAAPEDLQYSYELDSESRLVRN